MATKKKIVSAVVKLENFDAWYEATKETKGYRVKVEAARVGRFVDERHIPWLIFRGHDVNAEKSQDCVVCIDGTVALWAEADRARAGHVWDALPTADKIEIRY